MALPHYNPNSNEPSLAMQQDSFPVILVPADNPGQTARVRTFLCCKPWLTILGSLAVLASAALLWMILDPNNNPLNLRELLIPAGVLATCCLFFIIAAWAGKGNGATGAVIAEEQPAPKKRIESLALPQLNTQIEVCFEEWSSEPYNEIIDDAVLAEVFNDEMLAPDHMVISLRVNE